MSKKKTIQGQPGKKTEKPKGKTKTFVQQLHEKQDRKPGLGGSRAEPRREPGKK
jgi:hypothetical protein